MPQPASSQLRTVSVSGGTAKSSASVSCRVGSCGMSSSGMAVVSAERRSVPAVLPPAVA